MTTSTPPGALERAPAPASVWVSESASGSASESTGRVGAGGGWWDALRRRGRSRLARVAIDAAAPVLLTGIAVHELLYNRANALTWVLVLAVVWPLALRRRFPVAVATLCLLGGIVLWATHTFSLANIALLVALYGVAARRGLRISLAAAAVVEVGVILLSFRFAPTGSVNDAVVLLSGLAAAALLAGTTVRAQRRYLASVEDRAARLEQERAQQVELAAATERTRIAREMHDIVAHGLSVVIALAEGAALTAPSDPVAAKDAMHQVAATGRQSLSEMRTLLGVLRADAAIEHQPQPSLASVDTLVDDVRRTGLAVDLRVTGDTAAVPEGMQTTLFRVVREALTNVLKHAQRPTHVEVTLDIGPAVVRFDITDDGRGDERFAPTGGSGLTGMQERVAVYRGVLQSGPTAQGWQVRGELPTRAENAVR